MQRLQIYINNAWKELDLPKDNIALNLQVNDIAELKDRQASYSQSIALPKTPHNENVFAFAFDLQTQNKVPYKYYDCRLLINDINVLGNQSVLLIDEVTNNEINIQVLGDNAGLLTKMQDTLITDLQFDDIGTIAKMPNHTENYKNKVLCKTFDAYIGKTEEPLQYTKGLWYFVRFYELIKRLLLCFGYTLQDDVKQIDKENVFISLQNLNATNPDSLPPILNRTFKNGKYRIEYKRNTPTRYWNLLFQNSNDNNANLKFKQGFYAYSFDYQIDTPPFNCYEYTADYKGQIRIKAHYNCFHHAGFVNNANITLAIYKNGSYLYSTTLNGNNTNLNLSIDQTIDVEPYDKITITGWYYAKYPSIVINDNNGYFTLTDGGFSLQVLQAESVPLYGLISVRDNIPAFKSCYDLLKAFVNIFALTLTIDTKNKKVVCYTMQTLYDNIPKAKDFSQKLLKDDYTLNFDFGSYGQQNNIKFKDNDTLTNSATFTINNELLDKKKDVVTFDFTAGQIIDNLPFIEAYDIDQDTKQKTLKESKAHILKKIIIPSQNVNTPTITTLFFLPATYLLDNYYNRLAFDILQQCRVLEAYFLLTDLDVKEFDFSIPVFLTQTGRYYYVNKISNYVSGQKTKVTLLQL